MLPETCCRTMTYSDALAYLDAHASYEKTGRIESPTLERMQTHRRRDGRPAARLPGDPRHRHQRQGLDVADDHPAADGPRPHGRHVHQPAPRAAQRADEPRRRADQRRGVRRADRRGRRSRDARPACARRTSRSTTAAAFRWFADLAVDVAVVEVGVLGRWDATNVVRRPGRRDHQHRDGPQRVRRADARRTSPREKAGIIKPGSAVVVGETDPELVAVLHRAPGGDSVLLRGDDFDVLENQLALGGRLRRPAHPDDDLPRRVRAAARPPPGRQRRRSR